MKSYVKNIFYKIYKKFSSNALAATAAYFIYGEIMPIITKKYVPVKLNKKIDIRKNMNIQIKLI